MPFWFSRLELSLQDRMTEWQNDRMTKGTKETEWQKDRIKKTEGQKEIDYIYMILLWLRIDCNVEIYSNCATSCCTMELNSNVSYEIRESMVLTTSNLLSFLRISILLSLLSPKDTR